MVGGYFDLPIASSSRRSSVSDGSGGASRSSPGPRGSLLPTPTEMPQEGLLDPTGTQGRNRNAGILKNANRVKFTVSEHSLDQRPGRSTSETRWDTRTTSLPQRPLPTASIPSSEKASVGSQPLPLVDLSSPTPPVNGLTVHSRASSPSNLPDDDTNKNEKGRAIHSAQERAQRLASLLGRSGSTRSTKPSPWSSLPSSIASTPTEVFLPSEDGDDIPMISLPEKQFNDEELSENEDSLMDGKSPTRTSEAHRLVQRMTRREFNFMNRAVPPGLRSGQATPLQERDPDDYVEPPSHYRGGVLSSLLKLYDQRDNGPQHPRGRHQHSRQASFNELSGRGLSPDPNWKLPPRPRKWYERSPNLSSTSLSGSTAKDSFSSPIAMLKRSRSNSANGNNTKRFGKPQLEEEIRITVHIAELLARQRYVIQLCRALMKYGAPTHRLEEFMTMTARVLEIEGQFLYLPGCMLISFDDSSTHTTEVKMVRSTQGMELGKLANVHVVYKEVIHDVIGVEEATQRLDEIMNRPDQHHVLFRIFVHGCASAFVGPFAFNARPIDMPVAFALGCLLGTLQLVLSPRSDLYANVFEVSAAILISFLARAFGSIQSHGQSLFCFSALTQSSIALILPGYIVLCAILELQSRNMVAGAVRLVYAIVYSLFLGFGITIGTAMYGCMDPGATTDYTCAPSPISNEYLQRFPFVILFSCCLALVNQAKWRQIPVMLVIAFVGYVVNYFCTKRFATNTQIANAMGAFVIGLLANLYSRLRHGLAAAAMLPAIWVLVPSGLAASGSLISAIVAAEQMNTSRSTYGVVTNGTQGFLDAAKNMTQGQSQSVTFDVAYGMVQVAIGFTVGLFLAALVVYPFGKKRSGLFAF